MSNLESKARLVDPKRYRFGCSGALVIVFALVCTVLGTLHVLWNRQPEYWRENQRFIKSKNKAELEAIAVDFQNTFISELNHQDYLTDNHAKTTTPRSITITCRQVNAWLVSELPKWLANQQINMPSWLGQFMIATRNRKLMFACYVNLPELEQLISCSITPVFTPEGKLKLALEELRAGNMPIPRQLLLNKITDGIKESEGNRPAESILESLNNPVFDPVFQIPGSPEIRITDCRIGNDEIELIFRPEPEQ